MSEVDDTELDEAALKQMIKDSEDQYTKLISHPCEEVFDIEPGSTEIATEPPRQTELVQSVTYDDKDREIEENYQEIFDRAMDTFDDIQRDVEGLEGKYKARNHEVGAQFLSAALNAAKEKQRIKEHKDKLSGGRTGAPVGGVTNTQINVATSTADLVKMLQKNNGGLVAQNLSDNEGGGDDVIDAEVVDVVEKPQRKTIKRSNTD